MEDIKHMTNDLRNLNNPNIIDMYKIAGKIVGSTIQYIKTLCVKDTSIYEICNKGDEYIYMLTELQKIYKNKPIFKGIAFPCCISVNEIVGNYSPINNINEILLKTGDIIKIDLGVHINGFVVVGAQTIILTASETASETVSETVSETAREPASETASETVSETVSETASETPTHLIDACKKTLQHVISKINVGGNSNDIVQLINNYSKQFGYNIVEGVLSHEMHQYIIDGKNAISSETPLFNFGCNQVYAIDIILTDSPNGNTTITPLNPTIYKRNLEENYTLKTTSGRYLLSEISKHYPVFPFNIKNLIVNNNESTIKLGLYESLKVKPGCNSLLQPYPIVQVKDGFNVVQFKTTILINNKGKVIPLVD